MPWLTGKGNGKGKKRSLHGRELGLTQSKGGGLGGHSSSSILFAGVSTDAGVSPQKVKESKKKKKKGGKYASVSDRDLQLMRQSSAHLGTHSSSSILIGGGSASSMGGGGSGLSFVDASKGGSGSAIGGSGSGLGMQDSMTGSGSISPAAGGAKKPDKGAYKSGLSGCKDPVKEKTGPAAAAAPEAIDEPGKKGMFAGLKSSLSNLGSSISQSMSKLGSSMSKVGSGMKSSMSKSSQDK